MATIQRFANNVSSSAWTNPTNIYANDSSLATIVGTTGSMWVYFPAMEIPAGASLTASPIIRVRFKVSSTSGSHLISAAFYDYETLIGGGTDSSEPTSLTDIDMTPGGDITVEELNSEDFCVFFNMQNATSGITYSVDSISVIVEYQSGLDNLKTYNTNAKANIKSINTNLIANVKSVNTNV